MHLFSHELCAPLQVPPTGKGSLYIRPLLIGSGAILGVAPSPQYTFVVFVCPVGHYFKVGEFCLFCFPCILFTFYGYICKILMLYVFTFRVAYLQLAC